MKMLPMSKRFGRVAAAAALGCAACAAGAQAADGGEGKWYVGLNVPVMFVDNTKTGVSATATLGDAGSASYSANGVSHYGLGFRIGGVVGYRVLPNLRLEGELFYGFARVKKTVYSGGRVRTPQATLPIPRFNQPIEGNAKMLGGMVNAWYDIDTGSAWRPFVGGGAGVFQVDFSGLKWDEDRTARAFARPAVCATITDATQCATALQAVRGIRPKDKDIVFAYQIGGGIGYRWSGATTFQLSYKFQMAPGLQFEGENAAGSVRTKSSMKIHLFELGFRYRF